MPDTHFKYLVDQVKTLGAKTISIFGFGEPFMDKNIIEKVEYCEGNDLETFITTNASLLTPMISEKLIYAGLSHIRFSLHGLTMTDYNKIHKGLNYKKVMRNVFNFMVLNDQDDNPCKVSITCIGDDYWFNLKRFWDPLCDWLEIWKPHNWASSKQFRSISNQRKNTCGRPFNGPLQINADGTVMVCCMDSNATMTVGNTYEETIEDIMKGDKFNRIRRKHETGDLSELICQSCDQLNIGDEKPLLYSSRDPDRSINVSSTTKIQIGGQI